MSFAIYLYNIYIYIYIYIYIITNNFLAGHLGTASSESISANGAEILIKNTPFQQSFQKRFYLLSYAKL